MKKPAKTSAEMRPAKTSAEQIGRNIVEMAGIKDEWKRKLIINYVRWVLRPQPKERGRWADPEKRRAQALADWDVYDAVEAILKQGRASSIDKACAQLAAELGERGEGCKQRKAYWRHRRFHPRN